MFISIHDTHYSIFVFIVTHFDIIIRIIITCVISTLMLFKSNMYSFYMKTNLYHFNLYQLHFLNITIVQHQRTYFHFFSDQLKYHFAFDLHFRIALHDGDMCWPTWLHLDRMAANEACRRCLERNFTSTTDVVCMFHWSELD